MSEEDLAESLKKLLTQLIDVEKLECFGWPDESIDVVSFDHYYSISNSRTH